MTTEPDLERIYLTDTETIRRMVKLGIPEKRARETIKTLDEHPRSGFPPKNKLWGNRRSWVAVRAYLETSFGDKMVDGAARLATEHRDRTRPPRPHLTAVPRGGHDDD
jgi:hypothetical protein